MYANHQRDFTWIFRKTIIKSTVSVAQRKMQDAIIKENIWDFCVFRIEKQTAKKRSFNLNEANERPNEVDFMAASD